MGNQVLSRKKADSKLKDHKVQRCSKEHMKLCRQKQRRSSALVVSPLNPKRTVCTNSDARCTWGFAGSSLNKIARALKGNGVHIVSANVTILFTRRLVILYWKFGILLVQEANASEVKLQALSFCSRNMGFT